jgi:hypothetical protein
VVVLDPLPGREVVVHKSGTDSRDLVSAHRRSDPASADGHPTLDLSFRHSSRQRNNEVGIIVAGIQAVRTEINYLVPCRAKTCSQVFFQTKSTMVRANSYMHVILLARFCASSFMPPRGRPTP